MGEILIVSGNASGFLENSIHEGLGKANIKSVKATYTDAGIDDYLQAAGIVLLIAGEVVDIHSPIIIGFKQKCVDLKKYVGLYGEQDQIDMLKRIFPDSSIIAEYPRPVETAELVGQLQELLVKVEIASRKKNILVVDDSGPMLRTIMGWLEGTYAVALANSAASAFKAIEKVKPDLILLDYEMPICSGAQFLEMLRAEEETRNIPVIFLTSKGDADTVKSVLALKPEGYILKTTPEEKVLTTIENFFKI